MRARAADFLRKAHESHQAARDSRLAVPPRAVPWLAAAVDRVWTLWLKCVLKLAQSTAGLPPNDHGRAKRGRVRYIAANLKGRLST